MDGDIEGRRRSNIKSTYGGCFYAKSVWRRKEKKRKGMKKGN